MTSHSTTTVTTDDFSTKQVIDLGLILRWFIFVASATGLCLLKNFFANNGRNSIFNTDEISRTFFGMRVAFAIILRNFIKCVDAAIALVSDNIVKTIFSKRLPVTRSITFSGEYTAYIFVAMSSNK